MSLFSGRKLRIFSSTLFISVVFLFCLFAPSAKAFHATSTYSKATNGTLTSAEWNGLFSDFVNNWLPTTMNGPLGIGTTIPPASGLYVNGPVNALNLYSTSNVGIAKTNPASALDMIGSINSSGTINGTGLCIANDCKVSWPAVGAASSGWTQNGTTIYKTDINGNVGVGTTTPTQKLSVAGIVESTNGGFKFPDGTILVTAGGSGGGQWTSASSTSIYYNSGRVGIGTTNPASALDVSGTGITLGGVTRTTWPGGSGSGFGTDAGTYAYYTGGNVGFGVTNPTSKLQIYTSTAYDGVSIDGNNSPAFRLMNSGVTKGYIALPTTSTVFSSDATANDLVIRTENVSQRILFNVNGGGAAMMALNNGNVGIGTTGPDARLKVTQSTVGTGVISGFFENNDFTPTNRTAIRLRQAASAASGYSAYLGVDLDSHNLFLSNDSIAANHLVINTAGNVGIGKTNPGTTLDMTGGINASGTVNGTGLCISGDCKVSWPTIVAAGGGNLWSGTTTGAIWSANSGNVGIGTTTPGQKLSVYNGRVNITDVNSASYSVLEFGNNTTSLLGGFFAAGSTAAGYGGAGSLNLVNLTSGPLALGTDNSIDMVIKTGGNIGVGTTDPIEKLQVQGNVYINNENSGFILDAGGNKRVGFMKYAGLEGAFVHNNAVNLRFGQVNVASIGAATSSNFTTQMLIDTNGNISMPAGSLTVSGSGGSSFVGNVGISKTNPGTVLDVTGGINASGTVNGTGLCIGGDCKVSWPAVGAASSGWTQNGTTVYKTDTSGNVGIGTTNPGSLFHVKSPSGSLVARFEGFTNAFDSKIYISSTSSGDGGFQYLGGNKMDLFSYGDMAFNVGTGNISGAIANERMRITQGGNVGIGITNPGFPLAVQGTIQGRGVAYFTQASPSNSLAIDAASSTLHRIYTNTTVDLALGTNNSATQLYLQNGGNVGISTTNPLVKLAFPTAAKAGFKDASYEGTIEFYNNVTGNMTLQTTFGAGDINLMPGASGYVGIAKTNPASTLDVVGSINSSGTVNGTGLCIAGDCKVSWPTIVAAGGGNLWSGTTTGAIWNGNGANNVGIGVTNPVSLLSLTSGRITVGQGVNDKAELQGGSGFGSLLRLYKADGGEGIRLDAQGGGGNTWFNGAGNVGIGITNPTEKLNVSGNINITSGELRMFNNSTVLSAASTSLLSINSGGFTNVNFTNGSVGIGTTGPQSKLHVNGNITLGGTGTSEKLIAGTNLSYIELYNTTTGNMTFNSTYTTGNINFNTVNNATPKLTIQYTGNVGIAKTNPGSTLDVVGSINSSGTVNGTGLCIANDCKVSWPAVGAASSGWTQNGSVVYKTDTAGNVGIGTTNPTSAKLTVSGDIYATGASLSGPLVMNAGGTKQNITQVAKLTVDVIDPLYNIKGINYSSYAASIVGGLKEEYIGKIKLDKKNKTVQEFEASIDFSDLTEGSDLWVWRRVVNFNQDNVDVFITPYGRLVRTYYFIDGERLVFRSDLPVEISYRLVGKRFDWREWPTRAKDQSEKGMEVK